MLDLDWIILKKSISRGGYNAKYHGGGVAELEKDEKMKVQGIKEEGKREKIASKTGQNALNSHLFGL